MNEITTNLKLEDLQPAVVPLPENHYAVKQGYSIVRDFKTLGRNVINKTIANAEDYIKFVNEYKTPATKMFYNTEKLKAVFNFPTAEKADYADSSATLELIRTDEFCYFSSLLGRELIQKDFIKLLKKLDPYITSHDSVSILQIAEQLQMARNVKSAMNNTGKSISVDYEVKGGEKLGKVEIPTRLQFQLPMYKCVSETLTDFAVEVFYDYDEMKGFTITIECWQLKKIIEDSTREIVNDIVGKINVDSFMV